MKKKKKLSSLSGLLLLSPALTSKQLGNWLTRHKLTALKHLPDKEELIKSVFKNCVILIFMMKNSKLARNKIFSMLESPQKSNWMIFLDKLNISLNQNTLTTLLFKTLVQELTLKEKVSKPFWTPAYKELSEKLLLPTVTVSQDLDLISSNALLQKQAENSQSWSLKKISPTKMNSQKISYPLSISLTVDKWEKEVIKPEKLKIIKIKIYPTPIQKNLLNNIINVHRYVYNRSLEYIKKKGYNPNFENLRNMLATERTKSYSCTYKFYSIHINKLKHETKLEKDKVKKQKLQELLNEEEKLLRDELKKISYQKNYLINSFELSVSNEIRSNSIKSICDAYKTGFSNLKQGNIKYFNPKFKSKNEERKCIELASSEISIKNNSINICPGKLGVNSLFKMSSKNIKKYKNLKLANNCDLVFQKGNYYILATIPTNTENNKSLKVICGGDPGIRTFLTTYNNKNEIFEYKHNSIFMKKLNMKLKMLKSLRTRPKLENKRNKYRKKQLNKVEKKKIDLTDSLHWNVVNHLIKTNDIIFYGDIKSHNIVKHNNNKTLNTNFNDLKFFIFKKRLLYKASLANKRVILTNEAYTTQCCSNCGYLKKDIKDSEKFECNKCKKIFGRDENSAKNIMMKGIIENTI